MLGPGRAGWQQQVNKTLIWQWIIYFLDLSFIWCDTDKYLLLLLIKHQTDRSYKYTVFFWEIFSGWNSCQYFVKLITWSCCWVVSKRSNDESSHDDGIFVWINPRPPTMKSVYWGQDCQNHADYIHFIFWGNKQWLHYTDWSHRTDSTLFLRTGKSSSWLMKNI